MDDMFGDAFDSSAAPAMAPPAPVMDLGGPAMDLGGPAMDLAAPPMSLSAPAVDPAAGFLAEEQEALGSDLGMDLGLAAAPPPQNGLDGSMDFFVRLL